MTVGNLELDVVRKDIKKRQLAVYPPKGRVRISVPRKTKDEKIRLFVISKLSWIRKHQKKMVAQERMPPKQYITHESHHYLGHRYLMRVKPTQGKGYVHLAGKKYLELYVKPEASQAYRRDIVEQWYRDELKKMLPEMIKSWEQKMDVEVKFWGIKKMKTKWGSCNTEKARIWLNLELAKKPIRCLEYILVHEMVHLLERHHNERFRQLMDQYLPNWREIRKELNELPVCLG